MSPTLHIGRWTAELYQRAVHVVAEPRPRQNCPDCLGAGGHGWITEHGDADWEDCHCLSSLRTWRLPLWPGRRLTETEPF